MALAVNAVRLVKGRLGAAKSCKPRLRAQHRGAQRPAKPVNYNAVTTFLLHSRVRATGVGEALPKIRSYVGIAEILGCGQQDVTSLRR